MGHRAGDRTARKAILTNDRRRACLGIIRHVLSMIDYAGKDESIVRQPDGLILGGTELIGRQ